VEIEYRGRKYDLTAAGEGKSMTNPFNDITGVPGQNEPLIVGGFCTKEVLVYARRDDPNPQLLPCNTSLEWDSVDREWYCPVLHDVERTCGAITGELVDAVIAYATEHYNDTDSCWDVVIEAMDRHEVARVLERSVAPILTPEDAIAAMKRYNEPYAEKRRWIEGEAF